jgi:hypothetical protein
MPEITHPPALRLVNAEARPMAELVRAMKVRMDSIKRKWDDGLDGYFSEPTDTIEDRIPEGVEVITAADMEAFLGELNYILARLSLVGKMDIVERLCVREMQVFSGD